MAHTPQKAPATASQKDKVLRFFGASCGLSGLLAIFITLFNALIFWDAMAGLTLGIYALYLAASFALVGAEFILVRCGLTGIVRRVLHIGVSAVLLGIGISVLSLFGLVSLRPLPAIFFFAALYAAFFWLVRFFAFLLRKTSLEAPVFRGSIYFSVALLAFLSYAAITASALQKDSTIGIYLGQMAVLLACVMLYTLSAEFFRQLRYPLRCLIQSGIFLASFLLVVPAMDRNELFHIQSSAQWFTAIFSCILACIAVSLLYYFIPYLMRRFVFHSVPAPKEAAPKPHYENPFQ